MNTVAANKTVFLGDYFDDFGDGPKEARKTAKWLKTNLADPNKVFLFGNHDMPYRFASRIFNCPGFSMEKCMAINDILDQGDWDKIKFHHIEQGVLLTHAGLTRFYFNSLIKDESLLEQRMEEVSAEALKHAFNHEMHDFFKVGFSRRGDFSYGGIFWNDFSEEFEDCGIKQICGHTPDYRVRRVGESFCIDTNNCHYAIIENGEISFFKHDYKHF
jgi:hypothetical protein